MRTSTDEREAVIWEWMLDFNRASPRETPQEKAARFWRLSQQLAAMEARAGGGRAADGADAGRTLAR